MIEAETYRFADDGRFPNSVLPLLVYRGALLADPGVMEQAFATNQWSNSWRDGIFNFHHFHSIAHEVLGIVAGEVQVTFGGPAGQVVTVQAGDVVVIPVEVAHCNMGQSRELLVVGAYPDGVAYDTRRGDLNERDTVLRNIAAVKLPVCVPVSGRDGPLRKFWAE